MLPDNCEHLFFPLYIEYSEQISDKLDHKNLNQEVPEFYNKIPTAENIVIFIYNVLRPNLNSEHKLSVTLYETPRNFVSYPG